MVSTKADHSPEHREGKVAKLTTVPDLSGTSRAREEFPPYHDPMVQLIAVTLIFLGALIGSVIASGVLAAVLQVLVVAAAFLDVAVLLRSVRHGWNISAYKRARQESRQATTLRIERDALRDISERFAILHKIAGNPGGAETLQSFVEEICAVLRRSSAAASVAVVEEVRGRFLVLCAAGYLQSRPYYIAPGKSCVADRSFPELLATFAPGGKAVSHEVKAGDRRFWVGVACTDAGAHIEEGLVRTLVAWVTLADAMDQIPRLTQPVLRAS